MKSVISITKKASEHLQEIYKNAPINSEGILVGVDKSGCSGYAYKLDFAKKGKVDNFEFVTIENIKVFIDPKSVLFLLGSEMDFTSDKLSSRFVFHNPNEKSTCGCGESFNI